MPTEKSAYTFKQLAAEVLQTAATPLTADEIWQLATTQKLDQRLRRVGKTPPATLYADLHRDTLSEASAFVRVGSRPRRYWLRSRGDPIEEPDLPPAAPVEASPRSPNGTSTR